jgi:GNAT superfamily N-acetyltransferase
VTRTHVELPHPSALRPAPSPDPRARVERVEGCPPSFFRYLYAEVGRDYFWLDRVRWTDEQIRARLGDGSVEISYFGLLPEFQGRGLGKFMLTEAAKAAWAFGAARVWLHTCTLDHPGALSNYLARGFRPFKTETYAVSLPD